MLGFSVSGASHVGLVRELNQDAAAAGSRMLLVADGRLRPDPFAWNGTLTLDSDETVGSISGSNPVNLGSHTLTIAAGALALWLGFYYLPRRRADG